VRAFWSLLLIALALALPTGAVAATATDDVYDPVDVRVESKADAKLPYTGSDIAIVLLAGAAIAGTGFAIRRAASD
jgi:LPXTG-motif cell wall-anchored protein